MYVYCESGREVITFLGVNVEMLKCQELLIYGLLAWDIQSPAIFDMILIEKRSLSKVKSKLGFLAS